MKFFSLSGRKNLRPSWRYNATGQIWRLVPAGGPRIVGEERNTERKSVSFFCLDLESGKPLWRDRTFDQQWWSGIEAVGEGVMLLHGFATPDLPGHRGLTAVDLDRGHEIWKAPDLAFVDLQGLSVLAAQSGAAGMNLLELDLRSGAVLHDHGETFPARRAMPADDRVKTLQPVPDGSGPEAAGGHLPPIHSAVGPLEVLESDPFLVVVWYESAGGGEMQRFRSLLGVIDVRSGNEVHRETLHADLAARVPEVVFMIHGFLCYIKERQTLVGVRVPSRMER